MAGFDRTGHNELDRNLAFLSYGLLFFACFFAGAPALAAVAIAYARRRDADPLIRTHHSYQIWVFGIGFGIALLMGAAGLATVLVGIATVFKVITDGAPSPNVEVFIEHIFSQTADSRLFWVSLGTCLVFFIITALWLVGASAFGFIRLASGKPIGQMRE